MSGHIHHLRQLIDTMPAITSLTNPRAGCPPFGVEVRMPRRIYAELRREVSEDGELELLVYVDHDGGRKVLHETVSGMALIVDDTEQDMVLITETLYPPFMSHRVQVDREP